ncbi:MAG: 4'-phosphopantetheinyl transferase superfamily protein [Bacilli bacterium]|nr:4'-phosphopantetheinyl transferase superfamily protein [Bacilli bacterium]
MIKGIGVDIVKIDRVDFIIAKKVLSSDELEIFNNASDIRKREFLAGRFAIKEAIYKAGLKKSFNELNIKYNDDNSIYLENYNDIKISISHEKDYAIGYAIYEISIDK